MKKNVLFILFLLASTGIFAQERHFPTYGGEIQVKYGFNAGGDMDDIGLGLNQVNINLINGVHFNPYLYLGIGVGFDYYYGNSLSFISLPVFLHLKTTLPLSGKVNLFASVDGGYSVKLKGEDGYDTYNWLSLDTQGLMVSPTLGIGFKISENRAINLGVYYSTQNIKATLNDYSENGSCGSIGLKIGYAF